MDIITTARHFDLTPGLREHAEKRLEKLQRYLGGVDDIHVILTTEKHRRIAEIALHAAGTEVVGRDESDDMITSIDRVVDRIERQLKRLRARKRNRKLRRPLRYEPLEEAPPLTAEHEEVEDEEVDFQIDEVEDFSPVVVRGENYHGEPISVEEAIRILRESDQDQLLFLNSQSKKVSMVHLRPDGNYGFIESH